MSNQRYVRKDRRIYDFSTCRLCGNSYGVVKPEIECKSTICKLNCVLRKILSYEKAEYVNFITFCQIASLNLLRVRCTFSKNSKDSMHG